MSSWPAPRKAMSGARARSNLQLAAGAAVTPLPRIDGSSLSVAAARGPSKEEPAPPVAALRRSNSSAGRRVASVSLKLTPSMAQIADHDVVVELRGFPTPPQFKVGGRQGNAVTKSSTSTVHRGWRLVVIDGRRVSPQEASAALAEAQQRGRYSVTFRIGADDGQEGCADVEAAKLRADGEALQHLAAQREAERQRKLEEEEEAQRQRRQEAEEAARRCREAEEDMKRRRREREEAERLRHEAEEAERENRRRKEEAQRLCRLREQEEAERRSAEEAELQRREAEAARLQREREEEEQRRQEEERHRRMEEEEEERRRREGEERRLREEQEARQRREAEEAELRRLQAEEADRRCRQEAEEAERRRREAEEAALQRRAEEAREAQAAESRRRALEAERRRHEMEELARRQQEEAADRQRKEADEAERRHREAAEAERTRRQDEAAEADRKRREAQEAEQRRRQAKAERQRRQEEEAERRMAEQLAVQRQAAQRSLQKTTGLPPREEVKEPQKALMAALTGPVPAPKAKPTGPCDKCDGPHDTDACPHFKKQREKHTDAWSQYGKGKQQGSEGSGTHILRKACVVSQPGDGSCLFHSLSHGLGSKQASKLRAEIADYIASSPDAEVAGNPLRDWILWDTGLDAAAYAKTMRTGSRWGGALELAVCARLKRVRVHVYERAKGGGFVRISDFEGDAGPNSGTVSLLYGGRVHYDALEI